MKLFHKGLIFLVSVLLLQMVVFGALSYLWWKAEVDGQQSEYSRIVVSTALEVDRQLYEAVRFLTMYTMTKSALWEQRFESAAAEAPEGFKKLRSEQTLSPQDERDIGKLESDTRMLIELLVNTKRFVESEGPTYKILRLEQTITNELQPLFQDIRLEAADIRTRHKSDLTASPAQQKFLKNMVKVALAGLFLLNLVTTVILVISFNRGITRRLALMENSVKEIAEGKTKTHKSVSNGSDEIATLDRAFQEMTVALEEASAKDKAIFDNLPVGLLQCDLSGKIESVNPKAEQLLLLGSDASVTGNFAELVRKKENESIDFELLCQQSINKVSRAKLLTHDGDSLSAEISAALYKHKGEERVLFSFIDISQQEYAEQLRQEFISVVSHDLRTPLTSMKAFLTSLSNGTYGQLSERGQDVLKSVQSEGERLLRLTADLLDLARLEQGNIVLRPAQHHVSALLERALNAVAGFAEQREIELAAKTVDIDVCVDADRVVQVLVNFLSNAIKFSPGGSVVSLEAECDTQHVKFNVIDHGRGISPEQQQEIFERFKQARTEDATTGTGLGLAICKMLAEAHNGKVGVESTPGQGSTFWLQLPRQPNA